MLIFGYGSLVNVEHLQQYLGRPLTPHQDFRFCELKDFCRCWTAAMDNRVDIPGYKYYVEPHIGQRLDGFVTFLNIRPCPGTTITGIVFDVSDQELEQLDQRERNYRKLDVTQWIDGPVQETVWAYIGLDVAEKRYQEGLRQDNAVIARDYFELVHNAYRLLGDEALSQYIHTTDPPQIPIVALEKRQIPDSSLQ